MTTKQSKNQLSRNLLGDDFADKYAAPVQVYQDQFKANTEEYKESLPDIQDSVFNLPGGVVEIQHVGIHDFRLPLKYDKKDGGHIELETSVTGTVSLEASKRGVHLSRIMEQFYEYKEQFFNMELVEKILNDYKAKLGSFDASILLNFSYPILQESLRSQKFGYQYYNVTFEVTLDKRNDLRKFIHFDFVYSSTCPCSYELSEHARQYRGVAASPHSQRSKARVTVETTGETLWIEDLKQLCLDALKTETQVIVKRIDEQAFAELNAANTKFVEDASRQLYAVLNADNRIKDFRVILSHLESLHSHTASAMIVKGVKGGLSATATVDEWRSLLC